MVNVNVGSSSLTIFGRMTFTQLFATSTPTRQKYPPVHQISLCAYQVCLP